MRESEVSHLRPVGDRAELLELETAPSSATVLRSLSADRRRRPFGASNMSTSGRPGHIVGVQAIALRALAKRRLINFGVQSCHAMQALR
jgi:hypothetical protein